MFRDRSHFLFYYVWIALALAALATRAGAGDPAEMVAHGPGFFTVSFVAPLDTDAANATSQADSYYEEMVRPWPPGVEPTPAWEGDLKPLPESGALGLGCPSAACGVCHASGCENFETDYREYYGCGLFPRGLAHDWFGRRMLAATTVFAGAEAFATKADDQFSNQFGATGGVNTALGWNGCPLRLQMGARLGVYDFYGREGTGGTGSNPGQSQERVYVTTGFFKRSQVQCGDPWSYGLVWDYVSDSNFGEEDSAIDLHQLRTRFGYALNCRNEVGFWGTFHLDGNWITSDLTPGGFARVQAQNQYNAFWKHAWDYGATTELTLGFAEEPGDLVLGVTGQSPLNERVAMYGGFHYIVPTTTPGDADVNAYSEQAWAVSFGLTYYFGRKACAKDVSGYCDLPLFDVADALTFPVAAPAGSL